MLVLARRDERSREEAEAKALGAKTLGAKAPKAKALETEALRRDCHTVRLETGVHQQAAVRLYTRWGYQTRSAFAPYQPDPLSLFMEKLLVADLRSAAL